MKKDRKYTSREGKHNKKTHTQEHAKIKPENDLYISDNQCHTLILQTMTKKVQNNTKQKKAIKAKRKKKSITRKEIRQKSLDMYSQLFFREKVL